MTVGTSYRRNQMGLSTVSWMQYRHLGYRRHGLGDISKSEAFLKSLCLLQGKKRLWNFSCSQNFLLQKRAKQAPMPINPWQIKIFS